MYPEFLLISSQEAIKQYQIHTQFFDSEASFSNMVEDDCYFYIHTGDLELSGNLILDSDIPDMAYDGKQISGFIVLGNLALRGGIINENSDYGPLLYVTGNVSCLSMLIGGAAVRIKGDVFAEEIIMLYYNHGWMKADGTLNAQILVVDDFNLVQANTNISKFYYNDNDPGSPAANDCYESEDGDLLISGHLQGLLNNSFTTSFEEIQRDIAAGESILKSQIRNADYWLAKVRLNWQDLKRVPSELRSIELCMMAMEQYVGALLYFPQEFINAQLAKVAVSKDGKSLRYLPEALITTDLCYIAAQNGAILKVDIPEQYYKQDLLAIIISRSDWQMQHIPPQFLTEDLLVLYVKTGRGAWMERYCKQSDISKQRVLEKVISGGIANLENIFSWHLSTESYRFAREMYDKPAYQSEWSAITQQYAHKIARLSDV